MNHFTTLVRALRYLLLILIIFNIIGLPLAWYRAPYFLLDSVLFTRPDLPLATLKSMSRGQLFLGGCVDGVHTLLLVSILALLYRMLNNITHPTLFGAANLQRLRLIARLYLMTALYTPIADSLMSMITSWHKPVGQRMLSISFGNNNFQQIIIVLCIYVLVHLFTHAHRIETEHSEVI